MVTYSVKSKDHYTEKHGNIKGEQIWLRELKKKKTYESAPYQRLTKEWFMWKYPHDGEERFLNHAGKSAHTLDNFERLYGKEDGFIRYTETISKKNTVKQIKEKYGEEEGSIKVNEKYKKSANTKKTNRMKLSTEELQHQNNIKNAKSKATKIERYGSCKTIDVFKTKYPEDWEERYAMYKRSLFPTIPCSSSKECIQWIKRILPFIPQQYLQYCLYGMDGKNELKLIVDNICHSYDFAIVHSNLKIIFEYDGAFWHPSYEQFVNHPNTNMQIINKTYTEKYLIDQRRNNLALTSGYKLFIIRSDMSDIETTQIFNNMIQEIQNVFFD